MLLKNPKTEREREKVEIKLPPFISIDTSSRPISVSIVLQIPPSFLNHSLKGKISLRPSTFAARVRSQCLIQGTTILGTRYAKILPPFNPCGSWRKKCSFATHRHSPSSSRASCLCPLFQGGRRLKIFHTFDCSCHMRFPARFVSCFVLRHCLSSAALLCVVLLRRSSICGREDCSLLLFCQLCYLSCGAVPRSYAQSEEFVVHLLSLYRSLYPSKMHTLSRSVFPLTQLCLDFKVGV